MYNNCIYKSYSLALFPLFSSFLSDPFLSRLFNALWRPRRIKILGFELEGVIESTDSGVTRFKTGDAVCGGGFGAYAEYKCLPENGGVALRDR
ncbi:alcohol dehydrogenase catalytic domain-containing protein [Brevibacillus laterosporus]|uniref:alcohol dehydrogenase catalytic domain-containing protein n=1 Tax=Brevibacillus laterosporus TaxID=1465 RepID=UPI0035A3A151